MSHKYVSNKDVMKNEGFLAKLSSTMMGRSNPDPMIETKVQSSITWRKTSAVKARIKTATGTIAVYDDVTEEQLLEMQEQATMAAGGSAPVISEAVAVEAAAMAAGVGGAPPPPPPPPPPPMPPSSLPTMQGSTEEGEAGEVTCYLVGQDYTPEDSEGLAVVAGQKLVLVDKSSPNKRPRLEGDDVSTDLLDNSAAKHKMAIRPRRNHPDPRSRGHEVAEERWLVQDPETKKEGLVPSSLLSPDEEAPATLKATLKRTVQQIAMEETLSVKQNLMKEIREFKTRKLSSRILGPTPEDEARAKRTATIRELVETEEEFVKDLQFVTENYYSVMDSTTTPRSIRDHKDLIFNNFKFIAEFHQNVLIEGVKYHAEVPTMIGRTFLRLERDFDRHAEYCSNEPLAQEFLENNIPIKEYFEEYSQKLGDDKRLQEHLKLPIQRLNDYQLLLRELVKFSTKLSEDTTDLQRAYELMQTIPQRATDAKFISSIEGFKGNLFKLGRLLRHDWFSVREEGQKARDRYLFLFKARILITKVKRIGEDRSVFILKDIIRLPETSLGSLDNTKGLEFFHIESAAHPNYPIQIEARTPDIRDSWLEGIQEYVVDTASVEDLLFDDELRVVSLEHDDEDAGVVSPVPEVQEFEDLPEDDDELFEQLARQLERKADSISTKRQRTETTQEVKAAEKEHTEDIQRKETATDSSPPPKRRSQKATEESESATLTPEQVEENQKKTAEQGLITSTLITTVTKDSAATQEISPAQQQKEEEKRKIEQEEEERKRKKREEEEKAKKQQEELERRAREEQEKKERERKEREEKERLDKERKEREEKERKAREEEERRAKQEKEKLEQERKEKEEKERLEKEKKEREEQERKAREEKERKSREEKERKAREEKEKKAREEKEKLEREQKEKEEKERLEKEKERRAREERERKEKEERERKEREEKDKKEREEKLKKEKEEKENKEREEKLRKEKEEREKKEREEKLKKEEKERKEKEEIEKKAKEEKLIKEKEEKEKKEREEKLKKEKEEKDKKAREEKLKKEKEEKEKKDKEEKLKKEKEEKEKKEKEEKEKKEKEEKLKKEKEEKEKKAKEEKLIKEKEEKESKEREEKLKKEKEEKEKKDKEEKLKKEREEKETKEKEEKLKKEKEEKEKIEKEETLKKEKEEKERKEKEEKLKKEKEAKEKKDKEEKLKKDKEEKEKKEREEKEKKDKEEKLKKEKEQKEKDKEEKLKKDKEEKEKKEKEEKLKKEKEEKEKKEKEEKDKEEKLKEEKEKKDKEEKLIKEKEEKESKEREEKLNKEKEEKERKEKEEKLKKEKEEKDKKEREEKLKKEKEAKEKKEKEEELKKEKEEKEKKEREEKLRKEKEASEKKEREEKLKKEKEEKEKKDKEEKLKKEKEEKEKKDREERLRKEKEAKEKKEIEEKQKKEEAEKKRKEEAEKKRKEEEEKKKKEEEEKKKKEEEEKRKKLEEEKKKKLEEEKKKKEEAEKKKKKEEEEIIKKEAEKKKKEEEEKKKKEEKLRKEVEEEKKKKEGKEEKKKKEEKLRKEEEERKKKEAEKTKKEEEEKKKKQEKQRKEEEEKKKKKEQAKKPKAKAMDDHEASVEDAFEAMAQEATGEEEEKEVEEFWREEVEEVEKEEVGKKEEPTKKKKKEEEAATTKKEEPKPKKQKTEEDSKVPEAKKAERPKLQLGKQEAKEVPKSEAKPKEPAKTAKMAEPTTPFTPGGSPKPVFTKTLKGDVVEPGDGVTFVCEVAHPSPYFLTWLKDSRPLDDKLADRVQQQDTGAKHSLKILNCRKQDSGIYTAKATDESGAAATCSAQLLVQELTEEERAKRIADKCPFFLVRMKPTEVIENTNLSYTIHVKGDPMPEVQFFKDDQQIKEDTRVILHRDHASGHYEILISHVQKTDEATYKCVARNKFGKAECEATMAVKDEELVYESLTGKGSLLAQGEKAEFKWFRDGEEFDPMERFNVMFKDDEDTLALVFQNVTPEDAGLYTCVASTSCGKISCSAELTVEGSINRLLRDPEPPSIKEEMSDTQVSVGGSAMLEAKVGGYPKPELTWTKNGLDVQTGGRLKVLWEDEESVALVIKKVEEKDAGLYRLTATNELGEANCTAKLAIRAGPKIKSMKKEVACIQGQSMEYRVEVEGEPAPEVRFLKDGKPLVESDRIQVKKDNDNLWILTIKAMQIDDCGAYTVAVSNNVGQVSDFFTVATDSAPTITRGLDAETEKRLGMDLTLEVRAQGSPKPDARWFKNNKEIMADDRFKMIRDDTFYMLKIRRVERKDKGQYKCQLTNTSGTASTEGELVIRAPPDFVTPLKDACAKEGSKDAKMFVEWEANPKPSVTWFFKDKPIREETPGYTLRGQDNTMVLTIHDAAPEFVGSYSVKATNEYGDSVCKARFRLHEAPQITEGLHDMEFLEGNQAKYTFKAYGVPQPEIKWTKDGKKWSPDDRHVKLKVEGDDVFTLIFVEAKVEDTGHYVATVANVEGSCTTEGTLTVNTPPHIKGSNFRDGKTFIAMHKFVLEVEASAVPEATATWYLNGKEMTEAEDRVKFGFDGKKYTLERLGSDPEHSGEYKCVLKNKIAEVEEVGQITIKEKEARVRNKLEDQFVKEHTDAIIKCQIVGDPIPEIEWFRNGKPLPISEKFEVTCERMSGWHTLVAKEVKEIDKCSFSVKGKNSHGECETSCRLGVLVKPQPGQLEDVTVDYAKDLHLSIPIHAFPTPTMVWTLKGQELKDSEHFEYQRDEEREIYGLTIHSAVLEDAGKITFTASNAAGSESGSCEVKVHTEKPVVVGALEDLDFCLEDDVTFTLRASGLPLPECNWKKNGIPIKEDDKHVFSSPEPGVYCLTIKDLNPNDYGEVSVAARSLVGECTSTSKLDQKKLPCEVVDGLPNVTNGPEGDDVTLTVKIRASPRPEFTWFKDSDVVEASEKFKIQMKKTSYCEATITLTLVEAGAIDSGQYRLKITNELNEASSETALIVKPERRKPKVTKNPKELKVMENKPGIFKVKIIGFPKPNIKWMKDGHQVHPSDVVDTGVTADGLYYLEFKCVAQEDVGRYTVQGTNELGSCEAETSLTVIPPPSKPEFLQSLRGSKVILGYPVRMEVKLGGSPTPEVQWLKNGKPLSIDGTHYKQVQEPDGTVSLQIDAATNEDIGDFTCVAKNPEGDSCSSATLSVLGFAREDGQPDGPASFSEGLKDCCFDEGQLIRLPVAMKGGPVPNMKWYKDGQEVKLCDRAFFTYDGDRAFLEIRPAQGGDSGMYKCVVQNDHGSAETECEVTIRKCFEPPCFTSTFPNQAKLPGRDVKMGVKYDGVPLPELTWYFNDEPLKSDGDKFRIRKDGDGQTLHLKECTYSDSGVYKVVAKNREGQIEHKAELEVADDVDPNKRAEAPVFLKVIGDQEVFEGSKGLFKAIVSGKPEPEFKWFKDGNAVVSTFRSVVERDTDGLIRLSIRSVVQDDAGVYTLKAWNEHGEATCQGKLICETLTSRKKRPVGDEYQGFDRIRRSGVPMPLPDKPMISALYDRRATVSWMPYLGAHPSQPVTYLVEMCEFPEGEWSSFRSGIRGCSLDVTNLLPKSDYRFRVRVANKYGVSEPSPYVTTYRYKLELPPISYEPCMDPNYEYKGEGPYVPEGFRIGRDDRGNYFAAPRFLRLEHDTQYGLRGFNASVKWYAYGYPLPKVRFFRNEKPLDVGGKSRFTFSQEATGEICLFIDRMNECDVGNYECHVTNEHGASRQRINMALCEYPRVLQPLEEIHLRVNSTGKIMCRISGFPACRVQWYRDWEPIIPTFRLKPSYMEPDWYILTISGASVKDAGLYSCSAVNVAGSVHSSCMVHVEEDDIGFFWTGPGLGRQVQLNYRRGTLEDHYDIGDEIGRGTQGVVYHCAEHHTGRNFAAKSMWGKDNFKAWMHNEYEMMNHINSCKHVLRLYDAYESTKNMVLVTELCGGGELLSVLTQKSYLTEYEICFYIRQLLLGLEHMHDRCIAHLGLNIGDILLVRPNGLEIKIGDLSLARNIRINNILPLDYGTPEYVAPEVASGEGVTYAADMWALGIITYILISGTSPFRGENDRETLTKVKKGEMNFDIEAFRFISEEAKDFIAKLLVFKPDTRMDVKNALRHPWLQLASNMPRDPYKINTDRLKSYYSRYREWYGNASCKRWFRRRTLASCFSHPSKMVYPPGEVYTPPESPEREIMPAKPEDYQIEPRDYSYEIDAFKNESNYQLGPDTYLLQLRDVEFPCRLRSYMKVASDRSPSFNMALKENDYDYQRIPMVHERRRFTDVMDEEIDDERRHRTFIDKYTVGFIRSRMETCSLDIPRRLKLEIPARLAIREESRAVKEDATFGTPPFIREKPSSCAITEGTPLSLTALVTGSPEPVVQWFKNDNILGEVTSPRISITNDKGRSTLTYSETRDFDTGLYKVVARSNLGQVTHRFRLVQGHLPGPCDTPDVTQVSDTEALVRWRLPIDDGGCQILCYHLQMRQGRDGEWSTLAENIDHEFYLARSLSPDTPYQFRIKASNFIGWGDFSASTAPSKTAAPGTEKVELSRGMVYLQRQTEAGKKVHQWQEGRELDYSKEQEPVKIKTGENAELQVRKYTPVAEWGRGRYSLVAKCVRSDDQRHFALKILSGKDGRENLVKEEVEVLRSLRHERIAQLYESYSLGSVTVLVMEPLAGVDVVTFLASQYQYSEQQIYTVVTQVLDALSYLHWRGYCHLDLQPDNIVLTSTRRCDVKLIDLGSAQKVSKAGSPITPAGHLEYMAPEILLEQRGYPSSDIWSLGVVTYALLAGASAFAGLDEEETKSNIQYVRYKFEHLSPATTQEAIRFLMLIFKRDPNKRPTVDECRDHKWMMESDFTTKKRERAVFFGTRLREYDQTYHRAKAASATKLADLLNFNDAAFPPRISYDPDMLGDL